MGLRWVNLNPTSNFPAVDSAILRYPLRADTSDFPATDSAILRFRRRVLTSNSPADSAIQP